MSDNQWAALKMMEFMDRVRKALLAEYLRRSRELGLPWR